MLELYHNGMSTCSQKVRFCLAEKGVAWTGHHLDLRAGDQHTPEYLALNPNGVVPTLVDDGDVIIESTIINEYLDEKFPEPALQLWRYDTNTLEPAAYGPGGRVPLKPFCGTVSILRTQ